MSIDNPDSDARSSSARPGLALGWVGLQRTLASLGIRNTAAALEKRGRVHGLPRRGGGTHGKTVWFLADDIDKWTRHLTGFSLAYCVREADRLWQEGRLPEFRLKRRPRPDATTPELPEWSVYAVTRHTRATGEQVHRYRDGRAFAAVEPTLFEELSASHEMPWRCRRAWRFEGMRVATKMDLRAAARRPRSTRRQVGALLGALEPIQGQLRWRDVPGRLMGVPSTGRTRCLVVSGLPAMEELIEWVASAYPNAIWVIWPRRTEVQPFTLEEVQPDLDDLLSNLFK